jgi:hypothetical protein
MIKNVLSELGLKLEKNISKYTEEQLDIITKEVLKRHYACLGVCIKRKFHKLFHKMFGNRNNTPEQFVEFLNKIHDGTIVLSN